MQASPSYVLGHADPELERLQRQGRFLRDLSHGVFLRAGIASGMRVLDYGGGAGDVSLLLSELVGPSGQVISVDRAPEAVQCARRRMAALGVTNVEVLQGDETVIPTWEANFDAVVGRLVLLHQPDAAAAIGRLLLYLRPGGRMAFQEIEMGAGCWSNPPLPLFQQTYGWVSQTFLRGGMATDIGARMANGFERAGLQDIRLIREGRVESGPDSGAYEFLTRTLRTLMPLAQKFGIATEEEVGIDTLEARLRVEATSANARFIPAYFSAIWGHRPD